MTDNRFSLIMQRVCQGLIGFCVLLVLAFFTAATFAQTRSAVLHVGSYHFDRSQDWNEQNYGLGYRYQYNANWSYQTGFYKNSYSRDTLYAIVQHEWRIFGVQAGAFAGFVTGYDAPIAAGLMASSKNFTLRLVPPISSQTTGVISLELNKAF